MSYPELSVTAVLCKKDLYLQTGELTFKAGKVYEVICENYDGLDLRNRFGDPHNVTYDDWLKYFVMKDRRVLIEKIKTYPKRMYK